MALSDPKGGGAVDQKANKELEESLVRLFLGRRLNELGPACQAVAQKLFEHGLLLVRMHDGLLEEAPKG